jgi:hypothetical protein
MKQSPRVAAFMRESIAARRDDIASPSRYDAASVLRRFTCGS